MSHWRQKSQQVIQAVIDQNHGLELTELRKKISAAYPFGEREYHPYKIWLDQVNVQLGTKKLKPQRVEVREVKVPIEMPLFDGVD